MKQFTVRYESAELASRLKALARAKGESLNTTILKLLEDAVDIQQRRARLERYATWTEEDQKQFDDALTDQRQIDASLWR